MTKPLLIFSYGDQTFSRPLRLAIGAGVIAATVTAFLTPSPCNLRAQIASSNWSNRGSVGDADFHGRDQGRHQAGMAPQQQIKIRSV
jgi:hypothetical protein